MYTGTEEAVLVLSNFASVQRHPHLSDSQRPQNLRSRSERRIRVQKTPPCSPSSLCIPKASKTQDFDISLQIRNLMKFIFAFQIIKHMFSIKRKIVLNESAPAAVDRRIRVCWIRLHSRIWLRPQKCSVLEFRSQSNFPRSTAESSLHDLKEKRNTHLLVKFQRFFFEQDFK